MRLTLFPAAALAATVFPAIVTPRASAQGMADVQITSEKVADGIHMLVGAGGNLGVSVGEDGVFLIDDQFAPLTAKIQDKIEELGGEGVRFVLNTHFHGDHTGGNENFAESGSVTIAHDNVRRRMSMETFNEAFGRPRPPAPAGNLPIVTFSEDVTFHFNGETIHVFHVSTAHTDGDAIVHFQNANVIHSGDIFFHGLYPFIDSGVDGHIDGVIAAADRILEIADEDTRIIPGHGTVSDAAGLRTYRDMLATIAQRVRQAIAEGKSLAETQKSKPTAEFDEEWGSGFLDPETFVASIYTMLAKRP